jgi:hypothetical protein
VTHSAVTTPRPPRLASRTPDVVTVAAVLTMAAAGCTAGATVLMAVALALIGGAMGPFLSEMGPIVGLVAGAVVVQLALCTLAVVAAVQLLLGRRWAWWTLVVLSPLAAVLGVVAASSGVSLLISAAAVTVLVLLLAPSTRAWIAGAPA